MIKAFDIVPFALPNCAQGEFRFEETRDITKVVVSFKGKAPAKAGLEYLRKVWPETRVENTSDTDSPTRFGWLGMDDQFNVTWQRAAVVVRREGASRLSFTFKGLKTELSDVKGDYDVTFRRTEGIKLDVPDLGSVRSVAIHTTASPARTVLRVTLDAGRKTGFKKIALRTYNAAIEKIIPISGLALKGNHLVPRGRGARQFNIALQHMLPAGRYAHDDGLVTFELGDEVFTISLESLLSQGPVWFAEKGIFITRAEDSTQFSDYRVRARATKNIARMVKAMPEQSFGGAYYGQPRPHAVAYSVGCKHARQRFWLDPCGDIVLHKRCVSWFKAGDLNGKDTPRFKSTGDARFFFGMDRWYCQARYPDPSPVLAYNIHVRKKGLRLEQQTLALPLQRLIMGGELKGDDTVVALVRFRFLNDGDTAVVAELPVSYSQESTRMYHINRTDATPFDENNVPRSKCDRIVMSGNRLYTTWQKQKVLRCEFATKMRCSVNGEAVHFSKKLKPGETCEVVLKIPFIALDEKDELKKLARLDFNRAHAEVTKFWRQDGRHGCQLVTPEPHLTDLHAAHLSHVEITDFAMPDGSGLINTSVGTSSYGNFSNESCMLIQELDQRGHHAEARRRIELWIKYQGTVAQPGNFTDHRGMYFGAGGFECGHYNQHHGWVLWRLCEHYFLTRDKAWLAKSATSIIAGADWVFRQRRNTMKSLPHSRGWEHGFLPAGSLEDVTDFHYWLSTNSLTWRGVEWAARALEDVKHPDAARVRREADAYRRDLINGFETMRKNSPLVRLRDGRWVPQYPSRIYCRGRDLGWIRESLEGSIYLLISGLFDANSKQANWILDDYQDNMYTMPPYNYLIPDFDVNWFDRAGLSIQPNLLAGMLPHLDRDEIEIYIWMFFNCWCACYREEIGAMVEHPIPTLGYSNSAHFKTSDQANAVMWLRYMLVYEHGDLLHFGRAIPRDWFRRGTISVGPVAVYSGEVGVCYVAQKDLRKITAEVTLGLKRKPGRILVRFRHPDKRPIKAVRVNGSVWKKFDRKKGDVDITGCSGKVKVVAAFA